MDDQRREVERETVLDAPAEEVWEALTDERLLGEWLADEAELEPEPGGRASFRFADGAEKRGHRPASRGGARAGFHLGAPRRARDPRSS